MSAESEKRGHQLAEQINDELNTEFRAANDYRAAVEEVLSYFESIITGLDHDLIAGLLEDEDEKE